MDDLKERLSPGQPPLRAKDFAEMCGVSANTVRKWWNVRFLEYVKLPISGERRVPVDAALAVLRDLHIVR